MTELTIFIIDDDDAVRDSLTTLLESAGYNALPYSSGSDLLAAVSPGWKGCVIADVRMPGMDGLELQQRLSASGVSLPVIFMTGHGDVPIAVRAMKAGALDFIEKPFADDTILAAIRSALTTSVHRSSAEGEGREAALQRISQLTARERDVLEVLIAGHPNKVIAHRLQISPRTVELHRARIMEKTGARHLSQLVRLSLSAGITPREN
jgi:two-component system, LuxR family, response regulator FixJ